MTDLDIPALKPCPFCGSAAEIAPADNDPLRCWHIVNCSNPCCFVEVRHEAPTEAEAVRDWNVRSPSLAGIDDPVGELACVIQELRRTRYPHTILPHIMVRMILDRAEEEAKHGR